MSRYPMRRWTISLLVSVVLLAWVFRQTDPGKVPSALAMLHPPFLAWALILYLAGVLLRALRYRVLLNESVGLWSLVQVTQVRNMFADLLPARLGTVSYVYLLVRRFGTDLGDALSSFLSVFFLDMAAITPLMGIALLALRGERSAESAWGFLVPGLLLLALSVAALALLPWGLRLGESAAGAVGGRWSARLREELGRVRREYTSLRRRGALWPAFGLSLGVRLAKYGSWYYLLLAVLAGIPDAPASIPFPRALAGVLTAELSSALPVGGLAGFGTYELAWTIGFGAVGFTRDMASLTGITTHLLSQLIDYGLGIAALLFLYRPRGIGPLSRKAAAAAFVLLLPLAALGGPRLWTRWFPPDPGRAVAGAEEASFRLAAEMIGRPATLLWSSNRDGNHEILALRLPEGRLSRLTSDPRVDFYSRFSPEGGRVLFLRSREKWVSFRDDSKWDVWVMNGDGSDPRRLAERAYHPSWWPDGESVLYHRRDSLFRLRLADGSEELLADARGEPFEGRLETPYPSPDGSRIAVTVRGRWRGVGVWTLGSRELLRFDSADGCQICWGPGGEEVFWVGLGGTMKNRFLRAPAGGGEVSLLLDLPGGQSHEYFPRVSSDGRFLVFAASSGGHEHDSADYEIFLWEIGRPAERALRITWHTGNDQWPDLRVNP